MLVFTALGLSLIVLINCPDLCVFMREYFGVMFVFWT